MKVNKEDVIRHITGSGKDNAGCAQILGYALQTVYNWPNHMGIQDMKRLVKRMEERDLPIPAAWKKSKKAK